MAISVYGGKMSVKKCPKKFPNVPTIFGLLGMSKVNFSPVETLHCFQKYAFRNQKSLVNRDNLI